MKKIKEKVLKFFEISSKLKRASAFALAFLLSFLAIAQGIRAENATKNWIQGYYYKTNVSWGQFDRKWINGEEVFCINPEMVLVVGSGYNKGNISEIMSEETQKKIELIHHYGYALSNKNDKSYVYTQVAIWEALGYSVNVGSSNGASDRNGDYRNWLADVNSKINNFKSVPSWSGTTVKGKVGQTVTLNGEGKISGSIVLRNSGSSVWAEDGKIKIRVTENSQNGNIILQKRPSGFDDAKGVTLVYQKSGSQTVAKIRLGVDPPEYRVNLEVEKNPTKARVLKVGEAGEKVQGAVFEMSYTVDFQPKQTWEYTTGSDGYTEFDNWNVMGKTVYVREKSVPYPYIKSDEVKTFKVTDGGVVELKFVNKKQEKSSIQIEKLGEEKETVANAEFEISKTKDFKNSSLVKTGKNGLSNLKEFINEIGTTIYIRERSVPYPYEKSDEVKSIKLKKGLTI